MRDIDRDFTTKVLVRRDAGVRALSDLCDRVVAVGAKDSARARILPLFFLRRAGVELDRLQLLGFDHDLGKHGDTLRDEMEENRDFGYWMAMRVSGVLLERLQMIRVRMLEMYDPPE